MAQLIFHVRPPAFGPNTAVRAQRGHTRGAIQDGWLLYYEDNQSPPTVLDGRVLTRIVRQAWDPNKWDLGTVTGDHTYNQQVVWAEPITLIQPHVLTDEEKRMIVEVQEQVTPG